MIHLHKYELIQQQEVMTKEWDFVEEKEINSPRTALLYKCSECSKLKIKYIDGHWKII